MRGARQFCTMAMTATTAIATANAAAVMATTGVALCFTQMPAKAQTSTNT